jgi:hypothetical protein
MADPLPLPTPTPSLIPTIAPHSLDAESSAFLGFALIDIALVGVVMALAVRTALLRDSDPSVPDFRLRPYSLAKSQLAFWTVVIISCFIYIFFSSPSLNVDVLNPTALELLGISMGTSALAGVTGAPAAPRVPVPSQTHKNYVDDVLGDSQGINIHRLQMALWTLVFGCVFIYECFKTGKFPVFDQQIFGLMGISSATYAWFRRTEL